RLGYDLAHADAPGALGALWLIVGFFVGSFGASLVIEGSTAQTPQAYGFALMLQGLLLSGYVVVQGLAGSDPVGLDARGAILCAAMGMQNSLVTRLSGAVVRTTHLTGIMTDLGIEAARWYRWHRERIGLPLLLRGRSRPLKPAKQQALLLLTIMAAFFTGTLTGSVLTLYARFWAMALPAAATLALSAYAFSQREQGTSE
ncbi:MAG TPA: YoaK family protein, partial [Polyangiales bacterium]